MLRSLELFMGEFNSCTHSDKFVTHLTLSNFTSSSKNLHWQKVSRLSQIFRVKEDFNKIRLSVYNPLDNDIECEFVLKLIFFKGSVPISTKASKTIFSGCFCCLFLLF